MLLVGSIDQLEVGPSNLSIEESYFWLSTYLHEPWMPFDKHGYLCEHDIFKALASLFRYHDT